MRAVGTRWPVFVLLAWALVLAACTTPPPGASACRFDTSGSVFDGCTFAE